MRATPRPPPPPADRDTRAAEQRVWAAAADTRAAELLGNIGAAGGRAAASAGRAAKLIGRLGARVVARALGSEAGDGTTGGGSGGSARPSGGGEGVAAPPPDDAPPSSTAEGGPRALVALPNGDVVVAFRGGRVQCFTGAGRLRWSADAATPRGGATVAAAVGDDALWVGTADGAIVVLDAATGTVRGAWTAHPGSAVVAAAAAGGRCYTLAADGAVRAWRSAAPSPADALAAAALASVLPRAAAPTAVRALALTWNVNQSRPPPSSPLFGALADAARDVDVVTIHLQEVEMGGASVTLAAAREAVAPSLAEKGNANAQWWASSLGDALGGPRAFARVGLRQLAGMLVIVYARTHLAPHVGDVRTAAAATGVLGVGGNKGGAAVAFSLHRRRVAAVCSHLAAHQHAARARSANWAAIAGGLRFDARPWWEVGEESGGGGGGGPVSAPSPPPSHPARAWPSVRCWCRFRLACRLLGQRR